ncbi:hypothetical protein Stsp02_62870 [Streptomyces sp. NBRC 14336]|uniref:hypothetical protein n=1 Tax=Streptomyces sp. NBRC 14336 TaxID=3030992 RepID=UPI00249FD4FB|nr:hypothetical protein [Streptomyces sp. NBRC 14336]WBO79300.1 hypothetical protein SBE_002993 [Streptomyces sp. SBE_14.2]GLW50626.1 hypothetical protein Stsp02_62870 [Streptomyces sp. NBRC 14336]
MTAHVLEPPSRERGASPRAGAVLRPLTRRQITDRLEELGEVYTHCSAGGDEARARFQHRLMTAVRRPGFALLLAGNTDPVGLAYGFPVRAEGCAEAGIGAYLPTGLHQLAASGRLFAIPETVVPPEAYRQYQGRDWNLARRLQKRLLDDNEAALGVTLVCRDDTGRLEALRSWGWRCVPAAPGANPSARCRALVLSP